MGGGPKIFLPREKKTKNKNKKTKNKNEKQKTKKQKTKNKKNKKTKNKKKQNGVIGMRAHRSGLIFGVNRSRGGVHGDEKEGREGRGGRVLFFCGGGPPSAPWEKPEAGRRPREGGREGGRGEPRAGPEGEKPEKRKRSKNEKRRKRGVCGPCPL